MILRVGNILGRSENGSSVTEPKYPYLCNIQYTQQRKYASLLKISSASYLRSNQSGRVIMLFTRSHLAWEIFPLSLYIYAAARC